MATPSPVTEVIRSGHSRTHAGEHSEPLYLTSSFVFASAQEAMDRFIGGAEGNVYSRFTNPNVASFEQRLAVLEGGERCQATASGMAAILSLILAHLRAGDHIVAANNLFGSTIVLLRDYCAKFGVETTFVSLTDSQSFADAIQPTTKLVFIESPSNPLCAIGDIAAIAAIAHDNGAVLAVDNCFCTPILQQPLALGADIVVHSATKYIDGQGRCLGGAVVGTDALIAPIHKFLRSGGPAMSPFNGWLLSKSLETLHLRMPAHCAGARALAHWLREQPMVAHVYYPGFADHPQHALAKAQMRDFGGIVSFTISGGREAAWRVIDQCRLCSVTANLGDAKTTIIHPATTTHGRLTDGERAAAGISDGLIRIAVGLEDSADIIADLAQALVPERRSLL